MPEDEPAGYGDRIAEVYDRLTGGVVDDAAEAAAFLARRAGDAAALELGIGTGRVALPLAALGLEVHGIEASARMVAQLRAKRGGTSIPVTLGDFADVGVPGPFGLVFAVYNTFFALVTQDEQVRCFSNVAARLVPGGAFVIQAFVPDHHRGGRVETRALSEDRAHLSASVHDPVGQLIHYQHIVLSPAGVQTYPGQLRYATPAELDLMARLTGLRLRERWGGWHDEPFTEGSAYHVSVYGKPLR